MALPADSTVENRRLLAWISETTVVPSVCNFNLLLSKTLPAGRSTERRLPEPSRRPDPPSSFLFLPPWYSKLSKLSKLHQKATHTRAPSSSLPIPKNQKPKLDLANHTTKNTQNSLIHCPHSTFPKLPEDTTETKTHKQSTTDTATKTHKKRIESSEKERSPQPKTNLIKGEAKKEKTTKTTTKTKQENRDKLLQAAAPQRRWWSSKKSRVPERNKLL
jgi:hypothetical protein